jgi:hypothetical protein
MPHTIAERARRWGMDVDAEADFISIFNRIDYLAERRFNEYQPTVGAHLDFRFRLRDWLNNVPSELDQKILFQLVPQIFFVGNGEFLASCRAAYRGPIMRWLIEQENLRFPSATLASDLERAVKNTWFCSISDSMQIAAFCHVNNIEGAEFRPDWRTLHQFGDPDKISRFVNDNSYKYIVVLEDFVGSGEQMEAPLQSAANISGAQVLFVPLIIAPSGASCAERIANGRANLTFSPLLLLQQEAFICEIFIAGESPLHASVRELIVRIYPQVNAGNTPDDTLKPYGPFGFGRDAPRQGALIVMYTNCPDNSLPILHHQSTNWKALFPRSSRI